MENEAQSTSTFQRWIHFNLVGVTGVGIQLAALTVLRINGVDYLARMFHQSSDQGDLGSKNGIREDLGSNWACVA